MGFEVKDELEKVLGRQKVLLQEPMKKHTTFRVGGPADYFVMPETKDEIRRIITVCRECGTPFYIIGNGSNLLVSDKGYRGVIIQLYKEMSKIETEGNVIRAEAGASLARVANAALEAGLTGFEFASGIPGTLGGACVMNAGAYGGEMKDVLLSVTALAADGEFRRFRRTDWSWDIEPVCSQGKVILWWKRFWNLKKAAKRLSVRKWKN